VDYKKIGLAFIVAGAIILVSTIYFFPFEGLPGSFSSPYIASQIMSPQQMLTLSKDVDDVPQEYYVEVKSMHPQTLSISPPVGEITPMKYKEGTHYKQSYVYRTSLGPKEFLQLSNNEDTVGIWEIPSVSYLIPGSLSVQSTEFDLGNMEEAKESTGVNTLIEQGHDGENTIIAIIDDFPDDKDEFYNYFPWQDRILHYPEHGSSNAKHGIMTASIAADVSPKAELYLIHYNSNPVESFDMVLDLKDEYKNYSIICSNSYMFTGLDYYTPNSLINRKVLELTENGIVVVFAAGNFAKPGDHNPDWTLNVGYDSRNNWFSSDEEIGYPAAFNSVVSVAGSNAYNKKILSYSSVGRGVGGNFEPDVAVPTHFPYDHSPYGGSLGTSGSCPFMVGICSLILTDSDANSKKMVGALSDFSTDLGKRGFDKEFGYGAVDAVRLNNNYDNWTGGIADENNQRTIYIGSGIAFLGVGLVVRKKKYFEDVIGGI